MFRKTPFFINRVNEVSTDCKWIFSESLCLELIFRMQMSGIIHILCRDYIRPSSAQGKFISKVFDFGGMPWREKNKSEKPEVLAA